MRLKYVLLLQWLLLRERIVSLSAAWDCSSSATRFLASMRSSPADFNLSRRRSATWWAARSFASSVYTPRSGKSGTVLQLTHSNSNSLTIFRISVALKPSPCSPRSGSTSFRPFMTVSRSSWTLFKDSLAWERNENDWADWVFKSSRQDFIWLKLRAHIVSRYTSRHHYYLLEVFSNPCWAFSLMVCARRWASEVSSFEVSRRLCSLAISLRYSHIGNEFCCDIY